MQRNKFEGDNTMRFNRNTPFGVTRAITFGAIVFLGALYTPAVAQDSSQEACSPATLRGAYGFYTPSGFSRVEEKKARFVPEIAAGLVTFDGAGRFTGKATDVTNGDLAPETPPFQFVLEGTYTLDSDCTGLLTESNSGTHLEIVVVSNGKEINAIQADLAESRIFVFRKVGSRKP
jgi:hypothetical protein